jgi:hypothetical protein
MFARSSGVIMKIAEITTRMRNGIKKKPVLLTGFIMIIVEYKLLNYAMAQFPLTLSHQVWQSFFISMLIGIAIYSAMLWLFFVLGEEIRKQIPRRGDYSCKKPFEFSTTEKVTELFLKDVYPVVWQSAREEGDPYRGIFHYVKDIIEKVITAGLLVWSVFLLYIFLGTITREEFDAIIFIQPIIEAVGAILLFDSILQVADMIDSPGVGELTDVLVTTLGGFLLLLIASVDPKIYPIFARESSTLILFIITTVAAIIGLLALREYVLLKRKASPPKGNESDYIGRYQ